MRSTGDRVEWMKVKQTIVEKQTLEEKIVLGSGNDFWHTKDMEAYGILAAAAFIRGAESTGAGTSRKHFAFNN